MGGMNKEQPQFEDKIPHENEILDVHLREKISTNPQDLEGVLALLSHTGQIHNEKGIMNAIEYLTVHNQEENYSAELRKKISNILVQIVVFNERKNPALAAKVREALNTFIS